MEKTRHAAQRLIKFQSAYIFIALTAILVPMYTVSIFVNSYFYPGEILDPLTWHAHEMLFGFILLFLMIECLQENNDLKKMTLNLFILNWFINRVLLFIQPAISLLYISNFIFFIHFFLIKNKPSSKEIIFFTLYSISQILFFEDKTRAIAINIAACSSILFLLKNLYKLKKRKLICTWISISLSLFIGSFFLTNILEGKSHLHALFAGAFGFFVLDSLIKINGNQKSAIDKIALAFVTIGAILRVFVPIFKQETINSFLHVSMGIWTSGFLTFLIKSLILIIKRRKILAPKE